MILIFWEKITDLPILCFKNKFHPIQSCNNHIFLNRFFFNPSLEAKVRTSMQQPFQSTWKARVIQPQMTLNFLVISTFICQNKRHFHLNFWVESRTDGINLSLPLRAIIVNVEMDCLKRFNNAFFDQHLDKSCQKFTKYLIYFYIG